MLISEYHREQYQKYYERHFAISRPHPWLPRIEELAEQIRAQTVLDYGSGPYSPIACHTNLDVSEYDPGVPRLSRMPEPADLVVCLQALEHIESRCVDDVLAHIESLANKAVLIVVSDKHSSKTLPDGSPWHSFVMSQDWWRQKLLGYTEIEPIRTTELAAVRIK